MTVKNATRRFNSFNINARDCDDCTVQPRLSAKERARLRQEQREMIDEAFKTSMDAPNS